MPALLAIRPWLDWATTALLLLLTGLALGEGALGHFSGAAIAAWTAVAVLALLWPLPELRRPLALQAALVGAMLIVVESGRALSAMDGTQGALILGLAAATAAVALWRLPGVRRRGFSSLIAGFVLLLGGLHHYGVFGPERVLAAGFAFDMLLAASALSLGLAVLRHGLIGAVGVSEGVRLAIAMALAASLLEGGLAAAGLFGVAAGPVSLVTALANAAVTGVLASLGRRRGQKNVWLLLMLLLAMLAPLAWWALLAPQGQRLDPLPLGSSLALGIACFGVICVQRSQQRLLWRTAAWSSGLLVILVAALGLLGFLLQTEALQPWSDGHALHPLASIGHFALGIALLLSSESASESRRPLSMLLPAGVGALVVCLGVVGWLAVQPDDAGRIERASRDVASQLQARVLQRLDQFSREVRALERRPADSSLLLDLQPAVLAVADPAGLGWRLRDPALSDTLQRAEAQLQQLLAAMPEHAAIESSPLLGSGRAPWLLVSVATLEAGQRRRLLVDMSVLLQPALDGPELDYAVELRQGEIGLYAYRTDEAGSGGGSVELPIELLGQPWTLRVVPLEATLRLMGSRLPSLLLVMGLLLGGTLAAALRLAILARERAINAEAIAHGLEREVAARVATESALDRSLDEIGLILASISDGFLFLDRQLKLSFANTQAARLLGEQDELTAGTSLMELWPQLQEVDSARQLSQATRLQTRLHFEAYQPRSLRWLELRGFPHPEGMALLLRDVSDQRDRAQRLALSEATLRGAQRLAKVGSWQLDLRSGRWLWSDELYRILGLVPGQLPPSRDLLLQHVPAEQRSGLASALDALLSEGREIQLEHAIQLPSGARVAALSLARAERDGGGLVSVSGTLQDVSAQQRQAAELVAALTRSERQGKQLRALNRVSLLASQKLGAADLVPVLLAEIRSALGVRLVMLLPAADPPAGVGDAMVVDFAGGGAPPCFDAAVQGLLRAVGAQGPVNLSTVEMLAQCAYSDPKPEVLGLPLAGLLSVPLRESSGRDLGYLQISDPGPRGFAEDDLEVLMQFGQIVALSLDWARLIDMLQVTRADLQIQVDRLSRSRALLAGAERVAGLGTWQLRFDGDEPSGIEVSDQVRSMLLLDSRVPGIEQIRGLLEAADRTYLAHVLRALFKGGPALDAEFRFRRSDGRLMWVHAQAERGQDLEAHAHHLLGTLRDVTRARERQERERAHSEVLRSIATGQPLVTSLQALIASLESSFGRRVGIAYGLDPAFGISAYEAPSLPEEFRRQVFALSRVSRVAPSRLAAETRTQIVEPDILANEEFASIHAICAEAGVRSVCATPILGGESTLIGVLTVYDRAAGRPDAELLAAIDAAVSLAAIAMKTANARSRIEESRQRLRSLFTLVPDSVYALEPGGRIEDCNAAAEATSGRDRSALIGQPISTIVPAQAAEQMREQVQLAAQGSTQRFEHAALGPGNRVFDAVTTTLPIEVDGATVGVFLIATDVSAERRAQAALQAALADVESRNQELQDFAFVASHDLQEPLRKVQAFGDRLRLHLADQLDADGADYIQRMRGAAARMQTLINDLLAYSRVSRAAHSPQRVALSKVLSEVLSDLESRIESSGAQVQTEALPEIWADPTQMRQLLQNLLGNALKFAHPGRPPQVRVSARLREASRAGETATALLTVEDNGIGFDNRYQDRIFAPFQRLHGRSEFEGSGIGLAIVRKIVERHGGRIHADGQPGQGARFHIELPVGQPALSSGTEVCEDSR